VKNIPYWKLIKDTLKKQRSGIVMYISCAVFCFIVFRLCKYDLAGFFYAFSVIAIIYIFVLIIVFIRNTIAFKYRQKYIESIFTGGNLPSANDLMEEDYQEMIAILMRKLESVSAEYDKELQNTDEYISTWVHQIKIPISVMRMVVSDKDGDEFIAIKNELFRIEEYVDMLLQYIRLDSSYNDLVVREQKLDDIIKRTIHKYAPQFIMKKLTLSYDGTDKVVVTDSKWLAIIIDQIISNAIKYTQNGGITISVNDNVLSIADTGIGIAPEDLPCIFERGYTGINGRINDRASGIGLYLAKKASDMLSLEIQVESELGKGSTFKIIFKEATP